MVYVGIANQKRVMKIDLILLLGFVSGIKHALDADHLAAVSTLVSKNKKLLPAIKAGGWWGIGHTTTLMIVGSMVLFFGVIIPEKIAIGLEFIVALMLIVLGLINLKTGIIQKFHIHKHEHDAAEHLHIHVHSEGDAPHDHKHTHPNRNKAMAIGAIHGLAGSAAVTILVLSTLKNIPTGLMYIALFGVGSIIGMSVFSVIIGLPVFLASRRYNNIHRMSIIGSGVLSLIIGINIVRHILFSSF